MLYYAHDGTHITLDQWGALRTRDDYWIVGRYESDNLVISTVWLGIDHRFGPGRPLIFETMVFADGLDSNSDNPMVRYCTYEEADEGHKRAVANVEHGEPYWFE